MDLVQLSLMSKAALRNSLKDRNTICRLTSGSTRHCAAVGLGGGNQCHSRGTTRVNRIVRRAFGRMNFLDWFKKPMAPQKPRSPSLQPEASYRVAVDDAAVSCTTPRGETSTVAFAELESVVIRTTEDGPIAPDVFWVLAGAGRTCVVPQGATGEEALIDRLGRLPGFKFEAIIAAMSCAENQEFDCWKR